MKRKLRTGIISVISIAVAVSLLVTSISSRQQVQAIDVFSKTEDLLKLAAEGTGYFDIAELVDELSFFPEVYNEEGEFILDSNSPSSSIGNEELAYMVGGQEPYKEYYQYLSSFSWSASDGETLSAIVNPAMYKLMQDLKDKELAREESSDYPISIFRSGLVYRPIFLGNEKTFLEVTPLHTESLAAANAENSANIYGYFIPDQYGGVYEKIDEKKIVYRGSHLAYEGTIFYDLNSVVEQDAAENVENASSSEALPDAENVVRPEEGYDYGDEDYLSEENFGDAVADMEEEYQNDSDYSTQPNPEEDPSPLYYESSTDAEITDETNTVYAESNHAALKQETIQVLIPRYQTELNQDISDLEETGDKEVVPAYEAERYAFYTLSEIEEQQIDITQISAVVPVTDENKGEVKQFRYIALKNNEWLKTQVFGIGAAEPDSSNLDVLCAKFPLRVTSITTVPYEGDNENTGSFNLISNPEIGTYRDWQNFFDQLKMLYIHNVPKFDISIWTGTNIMSRVVDHTLALLVNDKATNPNAGQNTALYEGDSYNNLKRLLYLAYQDDIETQWKGSLDYFQQDDEQLQLIVDSADRMYEDENQVAHFVRENIYFIDSALLDTSLYSAITKGVRDGFLEVEQRIEQENHHRAQSGQSGVMIGAVTRALAIQYILTYSSETVPLAKSNLRILELQPCNDFDYAPMNMTYEGMANPVLNQEDRNQKFKDDFHIEQNTEVEIIGMTTSEFRDNIDDLNVQYDMIYWGANIGAMNHFPNKTIQGDFCTSYEDTSKIGNIYTHFREDALYNGSDNDISNNQLDTLFSFLGAQYPIVVADKFFIRTVVDSMTVENISSGESVLSNGIGMVEDSAISMDSTNKLPRYGALDTSSFVYQFVKTAVETGYPSFMTVSQATAEGIKFAEFLNRPKLALNIISQPVKYDTSLVNKPVSMQNERGEVIGTIEVPLMASANYLLPSSTGGYDLAYEFYISNAAGVDASNSLYTVNLYVDANMDGLYTDREKLDLDATHIYDLDSDRNENQNSLRSGTVYRIHRELPEGYRGALDWKLEVVANANADVRACVQGLSAVPKEKEDIYVCQFIRKDYTEDLSDTEEPKRQLPTYQVLGENTCHIDLGDAKNKFDVRRSQLWTVLLKAVPDYNIHIVTVDAEEYLDASGAVSDDALVKDYSIPGLPFTPDLSRFHILLFDDADSYIDPQNGDFVGSQERIRHVLDFMETGKSVLFTHNTSGKQMKMATVATVATETDDTVADPDISSGALQNYHLSQINSETVTKYPYALSENMDMLEDMKLLMNTLIAAYRVGNKNIDVQFTQTASDMSIKSGGVIPYDVDNLVEEATYPVYFQVKDGNMVSDDFKGIYYRLYIEDPAGDLSLEYFGTTKHVVDITNDDAYKVLGTGTAGTPVLAAGDSDYKVIKTEGVYQINVPLSLFKSQEGSEHRKKTKGRNEVILYLQTYPVLDTESGIEPAGAVISQFKIRKQQFFNMD